MLVYRHSREAVMVIFQKRYETFPHNAASWHCLFCMLTLGVGPFCSLLLTDCEVLSTPPSIFCLPTWSNTSPYDSWSSSLSPVILSLQISSPGWPTTWQRCFWPGLSGEFHLFLADLNLQRGSPRHKSWKLVINTSCTTSCKSTSQVFICTVRIEAKKHLAHLAVDHHLKSRVVTLDVLQNSLVLMWKSITSNPNLDKCQQPLYNVPDPNAQAVGQVSRWGPLSPAGASLPLLSLVNSSQCLCVAQGQLVPMLHWTELPAPHLQWMHLTYSVARDLRVDQQPSSCCQKSQVYSLHHQRSLHFQTW